jgi:hypothetical protein
LAILNFQFRCLPLLLERCPSPTGVGKAGRRPGEGLEGKDILQRSGPRVRSRESLDGGITNFMTDPHNSQP